MADRGRRAPGTDGGLRFHLRVQRSRLAVMLLMGAVALVARATGQIDFPLVGALTAFGFGIASTFLFMLLYRRAARSGSSFPLHTLWMGLDIVIICWTIALIHDAFPLWMIWYLTNVTAAAFLAGRRTAWAVMWASCFAYLATLVGIGEIRGLDPALWGAVGRLALLFGG